ncbi:MAG: VRR-NUC domain-containing protein [Methanothermobacter sp.]|nr:VRR-NUC domain-containing protein [Methanothermobacter sp.]
MISFKNIKAERLSSQGRKSKYLIDSKECFAEEVALLHYKKEGYDGIWAENSYWWMLLSLLFWHVIFAKIERLIPDSKSFMQLNGMPSDLFEEEFYERRRDLIRNRCQELLHGDIIQKLIESYEENYGKNCRLIEDWNAFSIDELAIPLKLVEREKLLKIFHRLLSDFNNNRRGLPDLILYNDNELFFAEVKSENDSITEDQLKWHDFLSKLGFKVELALINHTKRQIENKKRIYKPSSGKVTITFGYSTSKYREEAIDFIKRQETYFTEGEGKEKIYGATFEINEDDIEKIYKLLDYTTGWKTQKVIVNGEQMKSGTLRSALWCFRKKCTENKPLDYCETDDYRNKHLKSGCKGIYAFDEKLKDGLENGQWLNYGYVDTSFQKWIFNKEELKSRIKKLIEDIQLCPLFKDDNIWGLVEDLPPEIDPKTDEEWAFISANYDYWFWHNGKWLSNFGDTNFPGIHFMIGVKKLTPKEKMDVISRSHEYKII